MKGSKIAFEQGSKEWLWMRVNLFTASEVSNLIWEQKTLKSGGLSATITGLEVAEKYIAEKVAGNFLEALPEELKAKALDWGKFWESEALRDFCTKTGIQYDSLETGSAYFDKENLLLVSPDSLAITQEFGIEIKCPISLSNFSHAKINVKDAESLKKYNKAYYWQVMSNLYVTGVEKWYFVNYFPYLKFENRFGIAEIYPDKEAFDLLEIRLGWGVEKYKEYLKIYNDER